MSVKFVTGKLGGGKSLICVGLMRDYLRAGKKVASNIDVDLQKLLGDRWKDANFIRVPDKPNVHDLEAIGLGHDLDEYNEERNGILVLDECGTWFNARGWNDKERQPLINWLLHARKKRWNCHFIVQNLNIVDKQARDATGETEISCRDLSKMKIPIISGLVNTLSFGFLKPRFPKAHVAVEYNHSTNPSMKNDWWVYKGSDLYPTYDTQQAFLPRDHPDSKGIHRVLTPWLTHGRYLPQPKNFAYFYRNYLSKPAFSLLLIFFIFTLSLFAVFNESQTQYDIASEKKIDFLKKRLSTTLTRLDTQKLSFTQTNLVKDEPNEICSEFDGYRITGGAWSGDYYNFNLSHKNGGYIRSTRLRDRYDIDVIDSCFIVIKGNSCESVLSCSHSVAEERALAGVTQPQIEDDQTLEQVSSLNSKKTMPDSVFADTALESQEKSTFQKGGSFLMDKIMPKSTNSTPDKP